MSHQLYLYYFFKVTVHVWAKESSYNTKVKKQSLFCSHTAWYHCMLAIVHSLNKHTTSSNLHQLANIFSHHRTPSFPDKNSWIKTWHWHLTQDEVTVFNGNTYCISTSIHFFSEKTRNLRRISLQSYIKWKKSIRAFGRWILIQIWCWLSFRCLSSNGLLWFFDFSGGGFW